MVQSCLFPGTAFCVLKAGKQNLFTKNFRWYKLVVNPEGGNEVDLRKQKNYVVISQYGDIAKSRSKTPCLLNILS